MKKNGNFPERGDFPRIVHIPREYDGNGKRFLSQNQILVVQDFENLAHSVFRGESITDKLLTQNFSIFLFHFSANRRAEPPRR